MDKAAVTSTQASFGDAETADVKYVFLDIVAYTNQRSVEAQADIVGILNRLVKETLDGIKSASDEIILLPTGDGMAISFLNSTSYDIHLRTAVRLIENISSYNESTNDSMRQFRVRVGINENVDNVILDVNGRRNVAGNGITIAQRIMDKADGMQILVSQSVHDKLCPRERYMKAFRVYQTTIKHGTAFPVFQYVGDGTGLNREAPAIFKERPVQVDKLSRLAAYYIADAAAHRSFLISKNDDGFRDEAATVLLYFRAEDSIEKEQTKEHTDPVRKTYRGKIDAFEEQYAHYENIDSWVLTGLAESLTAKLRPFAMCFDASGVFGDHLIFPNATGLKRLKAEWPDIATQFNVESG